MVEANPMHQTSTSKTTIYPYIYVLEKIEAIPEGVAVAIGRLFERGPDHAVITSLTIYITSRVVAENGRRPDELNLSPNF